MAASDSQALNALAAALIAALEADDAAVGRLRALIAAESHRPGGPEPPAYTVDSLAASLDISPKAIRNAVARGELAAVKRAGRWIISPEAVAAWAAPPAAQMPRLPRHQAAVRRRGPMRAALAELDQARLPGLESGSP